MLTLVSGRLPATPPATVMLDASRVRLLDGAFKQRQELHRTGRLGALEVDRLLFPYRAAAGLPQAPNVKGGYGGWDDGFIRGHMAGHYLSAASRMFAATGDASFRDKANKDIARSIPRPTVPAIVGAPGDPSQWLNLTDPKTLTFEARDCGPASGLKFQPVHEIHHERFAVYLLKTNPAAPANNR